MRFLDNGPRGPKHVGFLLEIFGWRGGGLTAQCILRGFYLYELHFCLLVLSDLFTPECRVVKE